MTMIISGAPGDVERNDACPGNDAIEYLTPACSPGYGYGILVPHNATHLFWNFTALQTPIGEQEAREGGGNFGLRGSSKSSAALLGEAGAPVTYSDHLWIVRSAPPA
jgi:hypothetical protein